MDLSMTREERWSFVTEVPRVGVLSIEAPGRGPVSSPFWFTGTTDSPDGAGAALVFSVGPESRKAALLASAGRATMCVQSEVVPYQYVVMEGAVEARGPSDEAFIHDLATRYLGPDLGELYFAGVRDDPSVMYALVPQRWATLDYHKL
ncbi:MAG: hypothetical protein ACXW1M_08115 [Acidimicrobiia bacterium]